MQNALVRDLVERLYAEGVSTIWVGKLTGVLSTHWSVRANAEDAQLLGVPVGSSTDSKT